MKNTDPHLNHIARRVIKAGRASAPATAAEAAEAMQRVSGELFRVLETVTGPAGLQALIARAIHVAAREHPWLAAVRAGSADGALPNLPEAAAHLDPEDALDGSAALLAALVRLLITFIGEELTLRFVRSAWPGVLLTKLSEEGHE